MFPNGFHVPIIAGMSTMTEGLGVPEWTVSDRLRKAREVRGYRQQELADRMGLTRRTIGALERGETKIERRNLLAWAMATGVPPEWLEHGWAPRGSNPQPTGNRHLGLAA